MIKTFLFQFIFQVQEPVRVIKDHVFTPVRPLSSGKLWADRPLAAGNDSVANSPESAGHSTSIEDVWKVDFLLEHSTSKEGCLRSGVPVGTRCLSQQKVWLCVKFVNHEKLSPGGRRFHSKKKLSNSKLIMNCVSKGKEQLYKTDSTKKVNNHAWIQTEPQ